MSWNSKSIARRGAMVVAVAAAGAIGLRELVNSSTFQLFGDYVARVETADRVVALTFDDGPDPWNTPKVLDVLDRQNIKATFFMMGRNVERHPAVAREVMRRGHEIVVIHRAHTADGLALAGEFTPSPWLRYLPVPGRRAELRHDPLAPPYLRRAVPDIAERDVFVCGPDAMMTTVARSARALGVPAGAIHREELG